MIIQMIIEVQNYIGLVYQHHHYLMMLIMDKMKQQQIRMKQMKKYFHFYSINTKFNSFLFLLLFLFHFRLNVILKILLVNIVEHLISLKNIKKKLLIKLVKNESKYNFLLHFKIHHHFSSLKIIT